MTLGADWIAAALSLTAPGSARWPLIAVSLTVLGAGAGAIVASYLPTGRRTFLALKPLTTVLILAVALLSGPRPTTVYSVLIALGLLFALFGDVLLMFPERLFVGGIMSFAATHVLYLTAFIIAMGPELNGAVAASLAVPAVVLTAFIWGGVKNSLRLPIVLYVVLITAMAAQASGAALAQRMLGTTVAAAGSLLFFVSDAALAVDRFRAPFSAARALVLSSYWVGQFLIALSTGLVG